MFRVVRTKFLYSILSAALVLSFFFFSAPAANARSSNLSDEEIRTTLNKTMKALLTDESFSPALQADQDRLKNILEIGALSKVKVKAIMKNQLLTLLDQNETSRYILKKIPDRVTASLAPQLSWEDLRGAVWQAASCPIACDDQVVITIGTLAPPGTPWLNVPMARLIPDLKNLTDNKILIKIYGAGIQGEDTEILEKMAAGRLDGCGCTALGVLQSSPETTALLMPGLFRSYDEVDYIFEKFRKQIASGLEKKGYVLAALIDTGWFYMFTREPVAGFEDLRQQQVLTWFGSVEAALYDELRITATPVDVPDVISALKSGKANACLAPPAWMLGMQAHQYTNYYINTPWLYSPAVVMVSTETKERLRRQAGVSKIFAKNIQELIIFELGRLENAWRESTRIYEQKSLEAFEKKAGMKPVALSPEDQQYFEQAAADAWKKLAGTVCPRKIMNDILQALEAYRAGRTG